MDEKKSLQLKRRKMDMKCIKNLSMKLNHKIEEAKSEDEIEEILKLGPNVDEIEWLLKLKLKLQVATEKILARTFRLKTADGNKEPQRKAKLGE